MCACVRNTQSRIFILLLSHCRFVVSLNRKRSERMKKPKIKSNFVRSIGQWLMECTIQCPWTTSIHRTEHLYRRNEKTTVKNAFTRSRVNRNWAEKWQRNKMCGKHNKREEIGQTWKSQCKMIGNYAKNINIQLGTHRIRVDH